MPDFLSNLVDRALGQAPILQRRRRFLFEPPSETGDLSSPSQSPSLQRVEQSVEPVEAPAAPEVPSPDQKSRPRSRGRRQPTIPLASSVDIAEPSVSEMAESNATQSITSPRSSLPAVPSTEFQEERTERDATPVNRVPQQSPRVRAIETIIEREVRVSHTTTPNGPGAESRDHEEPSLQTPSRPAPAADPPKTDADRIRELEERLETIRDRKSRTVSTKPIEAASKPVTTSGPKPASVAPASIVPEIRVTIGRLEIHAATPSPPRSMRARSASPRLSLEAYLRSRSGGDKE